MNKSLLDTDILSEVSKAINLTITRNATAYRQAYGFLTLSVISVMEVIQGYQRIGASARIQAFRNAVASEEIISFDHPPPISPGLSPETWTASADPLAGATR